ncbi:MAG: TIGR02281 family clan AA aspartic protease, partial [Gammaproteobacteria bacterium]|nr:TIGR02281 family clan AA aspartic protease [Gammaproteobacteria bacterium]
MKIFFYTLVILLACCRPTWASGPDIVVQGLFAGKAVVQIDGQRRVLAPGQTSPEGVKLVSADTKQAILEVDGKQRSYTLGSAVSLNFTQAETV